MKLAILSRAPRAYSTQRLRTAALDRGHQVKVLNTLRFAIDLSGDQPDLQFRGRPLWEYDAVLPRIGNSITYFGTAVVRQFEQMDVYTPNTAYGITNSRDKLRATQILSRHNIGMPATTFVRDRADVLPAIERVGGAPVVIKLLEILVATSAGALQKRADLKQLQFSLEKAKLDICRSGMVCGILELRKSCGQFSRQGN